MKADALKHEGIFYTVNLPVLNSDWRDGGAEVPSDFKAITEHILDKDKKAIIHLWDSDLSGGTFTRKSEPLKNKTQLKKFASQLFLSTGKPTTLRLRISHDVIPSLLELNSGSKGTIEVDHIQEKGRTVIGFLVGSSPATANLDDMRKAHEIHPILQGLKLQAESRAKMPSPGNNKFMLSTS